MKRLTVQTFGKLLKAHPRFRLMDSTWCDPQAKRPCGGCAMTLAWRHAHPGVKLDDSTQVARWAAKTYGHMYVGRFVTGFDSYHKPDSYEDRQMRTGEFAQAYLDGIACRELAQKLGRLGTP